MSIDINDYHITNDYLDFLVLLKSEKKQWVEVKGFETQRRQLKRKLFEAVYLYEHPDEGYAIVK